MKNKKSITKRYKNKVHSKLKLTKDDTRKGRIVKGDSNNEISIHNHKKKYCERNNFK